MRGQGQQESVCGEHVRGGERQPRGGMTQDQDIGLTAGPTPGSTLGPTPRAKGDVPAVRAVSPVEKYVCATIEAIWL